MPLTDILASQRINPVLADHLADFLKPVLRLNTVVEILVVVDTAISTVPGGGFGVGRVIELIRASGVGCMRFRVDIALRNGSAPAVVASPAPYGAKYTGFRFDMASGGTHVIDHYEQIWCFGFDPDNSGGPDSNIDAHPTAATNAELAYLAGWMETKKGGLFATGDHDYLGASMCHKIPRIRSMRRWTNADGVPPIGTADRIDTLRPPSPAYEPGWPGGPLPLDNTNNQGDLTPQPIQWTPWQTHRIGAFIQKTRPHPVLCHPTLGPINIMPDHGHEGLCHDTGTVDLAATYNFGGGPKREYPDATGGGDTPGPLVIAYGSTLGSPPYVFTKHEQPARPKFPMISVYDGHAAGVGRVATDSTWHHWFDVNIDDFRAAGGVDWDKISRYYINLAVWLSPPGYTTRCLYFTTFVSHFQYPGFQEYSPRVSTLDMGRVLRKWIVRTYGPCWITQVIFDLLDELRFPYRELEKLWPHEPWPCLTCPPFELIEDMILGGLVRASLDDADRIKKAVSAGKRVEPLRAQALEDIMLPGVGPALAELSEALRKEGSRMAPVLDGVGRYAAAFRDIKRG